MERGIWISIVSGIPNSLSCIPDSKVQDSGFHKQIFLGFRIPKAKLSGIPESGFSYRERILFYLALSWALLFETLEKKKRGWTTAWFSRDFGFVSFSVFVVLILCALFWIRLELLLLILDILLLLLLLVMFFLRWLFIPSFSLDFITACRLCFFLISWRIFLN